MNKYVTANAELSKFSRNYMQLKKNLPIRPSEMGVLNIITETDGPHTSAMLAEMLGVSKPMITAHISVLSEKGYITKKQSDEDKRIFYIIPTEKAVQLVESAKAELNEHFDRLADALGESGFDALVQMIAKANAVLNKADE